MVLIAVMTALLMARSGLDEDPEFDCNEEQGGGKVRESMRICLCKGHHGRMPAPINWICCGGLVTCREGQGKWETGVILTGHNVVEDRTRHSDLKDNGRKALRTSI